MQAQVGVGRIRDRVVKGAYGEHRLAAHATGVGLRLRQRPELVVGAVRAFGRGAEPVSCGYQTSSVFPAASMLASPQPHAVRSFVMLVSLVDER